MLTKLAVVTGATGGIGGAISEALCAAKYSVCLVGRNTQALQIRREQLAKKYSSVKVYAQTCDITEADDRIALVNAVQHLEHALALWVNNAGISDFGLFQEQSPDVIAAQLDVNTKAPMLMTQALLNSIDSDGELQIINVGSTFGSIGFPGFVAYSASKFALRGFTQALSRELADSAIRIRYFAPRATKTALNPSAVNAMNRELKVAMDTPDMVAQAFMAFLRSKAETRHVGFPEKLFARLNQILPGFVSGALLKQLPVFRRYAKRQS